MSDKQSTWEDLVRQGLLRTPPSRGPPQRPPQHARRSIPSNPPVRRGPFVDSSSSSDTENHSALDRYTNDRSSVPQPPSEQPHAADPATVSTQRAEINHRASRQNPSSSEDPRPSSRPSPHSNQPITSTSQPPTEPPGEPQWMITCYHIDTISGDHSIHERGPFPLDMLNAANAQARSTFASQIPSGMEWAWDVMVTGKEFPAVFLGWWGDEHISCFVRRVGKEEGKEKGKAGIGKKVERGGGGKIEGGGARVQGGRERAGGRIGEGRGIGNREGRGVGQHGRGVVRTRIRTRVRDRPADENEERDQAQGLGPGIIAKEEESLFLAPGEGHDDAAAAAAEEKRRWGGWY